MFTVPSFESIVQYDLTLPDPVYDERPIFYAYILVNSLTQEPFYVGRGCGDRINVHERDARRGDKNHKCNTIRYIWDHGGEVQKVLYLENVNEEAAAWAELFLIAHWGRRDNNTGILTNLTDGGEGKTGVIFSEESKRKMSLARRGVPKTDEFKKKVSQTLQGRIFTDEHRRKLSEAGIRRYQKLKNSNYNTTSSPVSEIVYAAPKQTDKEQFPQLSQPNIPIKDYSKTPNKIDFDQVELPNSKYDDEPKYFVFILKDSTTNLPFFLNKGSTRNALPQHESEARTGKPGLKCEKIREIWNNGGSVIKQIFATGLDERTAVRYVMGLIDYYGRIDTETGILTNRTDGGPGKTGVVTSSTTRLKRLRSKKSSTESSSSETSRIIFTPEKFNLIKN